MQRLSKILARAGIASRREAEKIIEDRRVKVNSKIVLLPQFLVDEEKDIITVDDERILKEKKVYYLLNKPKGYICTNDKSKTKKRVIDLFLKDKRLFTVGRLDKDTRGLLIVTNDGLFAQRIIHPSADIEREYLATTHQNITKYHIEKISKGAKIEGRWMKPKKVIRVGKNSIKVIVKEGRKHEVRIFIKSVSLKVKNLKRTRLGRLTLGNLKEGEYRKLKKQEILKFF